MTIISGELRSTGTGTGAGAARLQTAASAALLALVVLGLLGAGAWRVTGGRWAVIETPSMGRAIPVGSLVLTRPRPLTSIVVGDVVTYRPPNVSSLYTHRVVEVRPDGRLQVQGDLNGSPDPFPVDQHMLVGQVLKRWLGLGWLLRALPTVLLALTVLAVATHLYVPLGRRSSARILGTCVVLAASALLLRPFVHPVLVTTTTTAPGAGVDALRATVVSTGLFPTRVTGAPGQHVDLLSGQVGSVPVVPGRAGGPVVIDGAAHLTGWWLVAVVLTSLLPMLWVLVVGLAPAAPAEEPPNGATAASADGGRGDG